MSKRDKEPTFEEALARLEKIVEDIEEGRVGLAESIARFEEGTRLIKRCQQILGEAELKIRQLQAGPDGQPVSSPLPSPEPEPREPASEPGPGDAEASES